jgi:hypothetical protein
MAKGKKTGGRRKGSANKATAEVKEAARGYTAAAISALAEVLKKSESDMARIAAARELLDRGHGKAPQSLRHEGSLPAQVAVTVLRTREDMEALLGVRDADAGVDDED